MIEECIFSVNISKIWITAILHVLLLAFTGAQETTQVSPVVNGLNLTEVCNQTDNEISVNFEDMGLTRVRSKFLSSAHTVSLSLRSNQISEIASDAFVRLPNLCYLDLSQNSLRRKISYIEWPAKLKVLLLDSVENDNNRFYGSNRHQRPMVPRSYPGIEYLYLRKNNLVQLDSYWIFLFPNVKHLFLSDNRFGQGSLSNIPQSVTDLHIEYNMIQNFHTENIENLVSLFLDGNSIQIIGSHSNLHLAGATNLEILSVAYNEITVIAPNAFKDVNNLRSLNLSHNQMTAVHSDIFAYTPNLQTLLLDHNKLTTIPYLCALENLTHFSLEYNEIRSVSANSFCDTMALKYLNLAGNRILNLELDLFQNIKQLEILDLSDNNLHELPADWHLSLRSLTDLYLNDNYFEDVDHLFLNNSFALQNLYLLNNSITTLNTDSLRNIENLNLHLMQPTKARND